MTVVTRTSRVICSLALTGLMVMSANGQARRRATPPNSTLTTTTRIIGTATDATNGVPVELALVTYGTQTTKTNEQGQFALMLPLGQPSTIVIEHPSFASFSKSITAQSAGMYTFTLTEKGSVTIKLKSNETHVVDIGTAQFANAPPFSGYQRTDNANFCKTDGTDFAPDKSEFSRILGPVVPATASQCCQFGSVMSASVEMKSGAKLQVYFKDSCSGNEIDFVGREKATGKYQYFNFTNIAEIDFP